MDKKERLVSGFVTIKIFARTELSFWLGILFRRFVTIKIFARTERCRDDR